MICTFYFDEPNFETIKYNNSFYTIIKIKNCTNTGEVGNPSLPVYPAHILIPQGSKIKNIKVTTTESIQLSHDIKNNPVFPEQKYYPSINSSEKPSFRQNKKIYESSNFVLNKRYEEGKTGFSRGFEILQLSLFPIDIRPKNGETFFYPEIKVTVELDETKPEAKKVNRFLRLEKNDVEFIKSFVSNPEETDSYTNFGDGSSSIENWDDENYVCFEYTNGLCDPSDTYEYVIITNNALKNANTEEYNWTDLINHRQSYSGLNGKIVTVEDITACSDYWNITDVTFNDTQAHIREFCKDTYQDWGTEYILLGGDWDATDQIVPYRLFTDRHEDPDTYNDMSCDLYYSNLDGDWYYDTESIWGGGKNSGVNDLYYELNVGRITAYDAESVSNAVKKIINYDTNNSLNDDWISKAAFWGGDLGFTVKSEDYMEELRLGTDTYRTFTGFEEWNNDNPNNQIDTTERIYHENVGEDYDTLFSNSVENDNCSIINHLDHSNWASPFSLTNWHTRDNTKPFFGYTQGCLAGRFQEGDSACERMMCSKADSHAYALVANTGYGWGSDTITDGPAQYQHAYFWDYFFNEESDNQNNWQLGKAFSYSLDKIAAKSVSSGSTEFCYQWYSTHLFGDPAQLLRIKEANNPPELSSENPVDQQTSVSVNTDTLSVTIQEPEGDSFNWSIETSPNIGSDSGNNEHNETKTCSISSLSYSTTYTWYVNATDGNLTVNSSYQFTTEPSNSPVVISSPSPANNSVNIDVTTSTLSVTIEDPEGDSFNWTIETSPDIGSDSGTNENNETKSCSISNLGFSTSYTWYVNATDSGSTTSTINSFVFTTRDQYTADAPPSFTATANNRTAITLTWCDDTEADSTLVEWHTEADGEWNRGDHNTLYNGTLETTTQTNLQPSTTRHYKAWSYNNTDNTWSAGATDSETTDLNNLPAQSSETPTDNTDDVDIDRSTVSTSISDPEGDKLDWTIQGTYIQNTAGNNENNGTKTANLLTPLPFNTNIIWYVNTTDGYNWNNQTYNFTTRNQYNSDPPDSFTASAYNRTQIVLTWTDDTEADVTRVERNNVEDGSWNIGEHTLIYNGSTQTFTDTGLNPGATYYYKSWSYNETDNTWSSGATDSATTTLNNPPAQSNENPEDDTGMVDISQNSVSIYITDSEGDLFNWTTQGAYIQNTEGNNENNGTKTANLQTTPLPYNSNIIWYVNTTDGYNWNNQTYNFTTTNPPPNNPVVFSSPLPSNNSNSISRSRSQISIDIIDQELDSFNWNITTNPDIGSNNGTNEHNGTKTCSISSLSYSTTYTWTVSAIDSGSQSWTNATYTFTTETEPSSDSPSGNPPPPSNTPPLAVAGGPYTGTTGQPISFSGSESSDADGDTLTYSWNFGDDETGTGENTTHTYTQENTYTITLIVSDGTASDTNITTAIITNPESNNQPPVAATNGPYTALTYQNINLNASSSTDSDGTIVNYTWNMGNSNTKYGKTTTYAYTQEGNYTITLTVKDNQSLTNSTTTTATIKLDSDQDGYSDEDEIHYGTNATNPDETPDTNPINDNQTQEEDSDQDGIPDSIEQQIGTDPKNTTTYDKIQINEKEHYMIDTNNDGEYDYFYNSENKNVSRLKKQKNLYLIDEDGDGKWDYTYDPSNGEIKSYQENIENKETKKFSFLYLILVVISSTIIITSIVVFKFKKKQKTPKKTTAKTKMPTYFRQETDRSYHIQKQKYQRKQKTPKQPSKNKPEDQDRYYFESGAFKTKTGFFRKLLNDITSKESDETIDNPLEIDEHTTVKYSKIDPMKKYQKIDDITNIENKFDKHVKEIEHKVDNLIIENIRKKIDKM